MEEKPFQVTIVLLGIGEKVVPGVAILLEAGVAVGVKAQRGATLQVPTALIQSKEQTATSK